MVYLGDARFNMGNSLMVGCTKMGLHFVACAPEKYFPNTALIEQCQAIAAETGAVLEFITGPKEAVKDAHALYPDVWVSMGEADSVWQERIEELTPYRVTSQLIAIAGEPVYQRINSAASCPVCLLSMIKNHHRSADP